MAAPRSRATRCTVFVHPQRPAIDLAIATGCSKRQIGARFKVSTDAAWRHGKAHLTPEMRAALATKILLEEGAGIVDALKAVRAPLFSLFLAAVDVADGKTAANLAGRLHESLALSAKVTGELTPHAAVTITNVLLSPDFMRLRAELLRVLGRHPEARAEVAAVFRNAGERAAAEIRAGEPRVIEHAAA
jgi:hypothetical protein